MDFGDKRGRFDTGLDIRLILDGDREEAYDLAMDMIANAELSNGPVTVISSCHGGDGDHYAPECRVYNQELTEEQIDKVVEVQRPGPDPLHKDNE